MCSVLQILVKAIIKWSKDICSLNLPLYLWQLNLLYSESSNAAISQVVNLNTCHKRPSCSSSNEWWYFLSTKHFTQLTCSQSFWNKFLFVLLRSELSLCTYSLSSSIRRDFETSRCTWKWWLVCTKWWKSNLNFLFIVTCMWCHRITAISKMFLLYKYVLKYISE